MNPFDMERKLTELLRRRWVLSAEGNMFILRLGKKYNGHVDLSQCVNNAYDRTDK